jgi:hypothetical protein
MGWREGEEKRRREWREERGWEYNSRGGALERT